MFIGMLKTLISLLRCYAMHERFLLAGIFQVKHQQVLKTWGRERDHSTFYGCLFQNCKLQ
jgi:hypothetical protein